MDSVIRYPLNDGVYIVCPVCYSLARDWRIYEELIVIGDVYIDEDGCYDVDEDESYRVTPVATHNNGKCIVLVDPIDLRIVIEKGRVVEVGDYWAKHPKRLEKVKYIYGLTE